MATKTFDLPGGEFSLVWGGCAVPWLELTLGPKPLPESRPQSPDCVTWDKRFKLPEPQICQPDCSGAGVGIPSSWVSGYLLQVGPGLPNAEGRSAAL